MKNVIENHRIESGADYVHVSLGPKANPYEVEKILLEVRTLKNEYDSFSELEKSLAENKILKSQLKRITKLVQTDVNVFIDQSEDVTNLKRVIIQISDEISNFENKIESLKEIRKDREKTLQNKFDVV